MTLLGIRLALSGGRSSLVILALTAAAVALGSAVLLFALSLSPALDTRYAHLAWRDIGRSADSVLTAQRGLLMSVTDDRFEGRKVARIDLAALSTDAPIPPGIPALPGPGESYVSAALSELLRVTPTDRLGLRFGRVIGTIDDVALAAPDELTAIVGDPLPEARSSATGVITQFATGGRAPDVSPALLLVVLLAIVGSLTPVVVFVATATRLSAARRQDRLALLRLIGATPWQTERMAIGEALAATVPGALVGVGLFVLARPLVAQVEVNRATWFPDAIMPPIPAAVLILVAIQGLAVVAAILGLRRVIVSPLGVVRRERQRRGPRRLRLVPLLASLAIFGAGIAWTAFANGRSSAPALMVVAGVFGLIVGIAIAGPWVTAVLGRSLARLARGPSLLIAARRLSDEPQRTFGAINGVVMAVFVASVFFTLLGFARSAEDRAAGYPLRASTLVVLLPSANRAQAKTLSGPLPSQVNGVTGISLVREATLTHGRRTLSAWLMSCTDLTQVVPLATPCGTASVLVTNGASSDTLAVGDLLRPVGPDGKASGQGEPLQTTFASGVLTTTTGDVQGLPDVVIDPLVVHGEGQGFDPSTLLVATNGDPAVGERARTWLLERLPGAVIRTLPELIVDGTSTVREFARMIILGTIATLLVAGCSLAVSSIGGILDRRRPFSLLRQSGMSLGRLRAIVLIEAAAPLIATSLVSALLGVLVAEIILRSLASVAVPPPDPALGLLLVAGLGAALAVVALTLPLLGRLTSLNATRFE